MRAKVAQLAARSVRYLDAGSGRTLILLHAFPLNADQWLPQLARVPPGWRFVAPDLRGLGEAEPVMGDVTMDTHANDIVELMNHLDIRETALCGLSMGGYVAFAVLRKSAARVTGLVLADTRASADSSEGRAARDRMLDLIDRDGPAGVAQEMIPRVLGETTRREQPELGDVVARMIESRSADGIKAAVRALKHRRDATELLPSIGCPTLVVCGAEDTLTPPAEAEALARAIPGARLVILPRAGHLSNLEAPVAFNEALRGTGLFSTDSARTGPGVW